MTDEKNPQEAKVRSGLSAKRNPVSYQVMQDIVIPAGTLLRGEGTGEYRTRIGLGAPGDCGEFTVDIPTGTPCPAGLKRVIAA